MQQILNETLSEIADSLVSTGIYQYATEALLAIATDFIDRKIENYQNIVRYYEQKHNCSLKNYAKQLENKASMEQEIDYEEWEIAEGMFTSFSSSVSRNRFASLTDAFGLRLNDWREANKNLNSPNLDTMPT